MQINFKDIPDVEFDAQSIGSSVYRIPKPQTGKVAYLSTWKPPKLSKQKQQPVVEEDEPLTTICGVENPFAGIYEDAESADDEDSIFKYQDGYWFVEQSFSHHFHKAAFGKHLSKLQSIEREYDCLIRIMGSDILRISSPSKINLTRLLMYLGEASSSAKLKYTHFVCIPLTDSREVQSSLESLSDQITDPKLKGAFISARKLHFTLAMLKLHNLQDLERVKAILTSFSGCLKNEPIKVDLRGIQLMNEDDPSSFKVGYTGGVGGDGPSGWRTRLSRIAEELVGRLREEGYIDSKKSRSFYDGVNGKLHATIINMKYAPRTPDDRESDSDSDENMGRTEWVPPAAKAHTRRGLDGVELLKRFRDFYFGQVSAKEMRLCSLVEQSGEPKDSTGFYHTDLVVQL